METKSCDTDNSGAHGFGMNTLKRLREQAPGADAQLELDKRICNQMAMIETFVDSDGALLPEFKEHGSTICD